MKKLLFAMTLMFFGMITFAQNTSHLLDKYISMKNALVNGQAANAAIKTFHDAVKSEAHFAQKAELLKASEKLSKAGSIEKQRAVFNDVSTTMWKLTKKSDQINQAVYYQYCPMKKAYWLSYEKDIKNPYYGASMLTCGSVVETK